MCGALALRRAGLLSLPVVSWLQAIGFFEGFSLSSALLAVLVREEHAGDIRQVKKAQV